MSLQFNMADQIDTDRFLMNGKALCLMNCAMFLYRVPRGGDRLHADFQRRLTRAVLYCVVKWSLRNIVVQWRILDFVSRAKQARASFIPIPLHTSILCPILSALPSPRPYSQQIDSFGWNSVLQNITQPNKTRNLWRFELFQRSSSEEAGTQFFWLLTWWPAVVSRKRSHVWLSW